MRPRPQRGQGWRKGGRLSLMNQIFSRAGFFSKTTCTAVCIPVAQNNPERKADLKKKG